MSRYKVMTESFVPQPYDIKSLMCSAVIYNVGFLELCRMGRLGGRLLISLIFDVILGGNDAHSGCDDLRYCSIVLGCHCLK